jgi:hypothetical protein
MPVLVLEADPQAASTVRPARAARAAVRKRNGRLMLRVQ